MKSVRQAIRWILGNWQGTTGRELAGLVLWGLIAIPVAVVEISAAAGWFNAPWPTISTTIGHLEDAWHPFALVIVILIASVVLLAVAKGAPSLTKRSGLPGQISGRAFLWDGTVVAVAIAAGYLVDHSGSHLLYPGYWTYGIFAAFGIALPSIYALKTGKQPALFSTTRSLESRLPWFRFVLGAGMAVLVFHLALYPWPDVVHQSTSIGNVSSGKAKRLVAEKYPRWANAYVTVVRGKRSADPDAKEAWIVTFYSAAAGRGDCLAAVGRDSVVVKLRGCA